MAYWVHGILIVVGLGVFFAGLYAALWTERSQEILKALSERSDDELRGLGNKIATIGFILALIGIYSIYRGG